VKGRAHRRSRIPRFFPVSNGHGDPIAVLSRPMASVRRPVVEVFA
jgi:hypothetical protein